MFYLTREASISLAHEPDHVSFFRRYARGSRPVVRFWQACLSVEVERLFEGGALADVSVSTGYD